MSFYVDPKQLCPTYPFLEYVMKKGKKVSAGFSFDIAAVAGAMGKSIDELEECIFIAMVRSSFYVCFPSPYHSVPRNPTRFPATKRFHHFIYQLNKNQKILMS